MSVITYFYCTANDYQTADTHIGVKYSLLLGYVFDNSLAPGEKKSCWDGLEHPYQSSLAQIQDICVNINS